MGPLPAAIERGPNELQQIAASLGGLVPGLNTAFGSYMEGVRQAEGAEAETAATRAGLRQDVRNWASAVQADPSLADRSPYYRRIYEERLARTLVQRRGNEVFADYWQSPLAGSADPNAVQGWLEEKFRDTLDGLAENPTALAAASEELRAQATQLTRTHAQNAAQNLVKRNEDSFNSAVGAAFDEAAQRHQPMAALTERLQTLEAEARAQGVDGRQINTILSAQLGEAIVRHNRSDFAQVGRENRPDGTPGFATTAHGRQAIAQAQDRVHAAAVRASNLGYTQEMRARAGAGDDAMRQVATAFAQAAQDGRTPTLTPQDIQRLASVDPGLASRALDLQRGMRSYADERHVQPGLVAVTEAQIWTGEMDERGLLQLHLAEGGSRIGTDNFNRLMGMVRSARNDGFLNDGAVRNIVQDFGRFVSRPDPMTGAIEGPSALAAARYQSQLIGSLAEYRRANPNKSNGEYLQWLQQEAERMLPSFVPREELNAARAREQGARDSNMASYPRPPAPAAPVQPTAPQGGPAPALPPIGNARPSAAPIPDASAPVGARIGPALQNAGSFLAWITGTPRPDIPAAAFTQLVDPPADGAASGPSAGPIAFPADGIQRRGSLGQGPVIPYNFGAFGTPTPAEVHVAALLRGLRADPTDMELIRDFDRRYGSNAASYFVEQYNRLAAGRPR